MSELKRCEMCGNPPEHPAVNSRGEPCPCHCHISAAFILKGANE